MDKPPNLHERIACTLGAGVVATPLSFLIWFGLNLRLFGSSELAIFWVFVAIGIIALLGFVFTYRISKMVVALWKFVSWFRG